MGWPEEWSVEDAATRIHEAYKGYAWMSGRLAEAIAAAALRLDTNPFDLANVIRSESQFNPQAQNILGEVVGDPAAHVYTYLSHPSQHTGLIQFSNSSAAGLGTNSGKLFDMSPERQMPYVEKYFEARRPVDTQQRLFMAVFYPDYKDREPDEEFPADVIKANPGKRTPNDYAAGVMKYARLTPDGEIVTTAPNRGMYRRPAPATVGGASSRNQDVLGALAGRFGRS